MAYTGRVWEVAMAAVHYQVGAFPPRELDWGRLVPLLGPAAAAVARYEGVLGGMPNAAVLLAPLSTQEAVLSSRIEGTRATMDDVLRFEAGEDVAREDRDEVAEVLNYRAALAHAVELLAELPLSQRIVRAAHRVLMTGVRGGQKAPGEYRRVQNWIGGPGSTIATARYVPIAADLLPAAMGTWERYLHADEPDRLVQLAVIHAEFEALHPFLDGNGRLGRLLVPLYLYATGLLSSPSFYLSAELESRRHEYYDHLLRVSSHGDWTGWCVFFLGALTRQAEANQRTAEAILDLYQRVQAQLAAVSGSTHAHAVVDALFRHPIFRSTSLAAAAGLTKPTAARMVRLAREAGLLTERRPARGRQPALLAFQPLLDLAEGGAVVDHG